MTKDYAKPSTTRKSGSAKRNGGKTPSPRKKSGTKASANKAAAPQKTGQAKYIVLILIVIGGFGYTLYELAKVPQSKQAASQIAPSQPDTSESSKQAVAPKEQPSTEPEARFQFYDLLPNSEVETGTVDAYTFKEKGESEIYRYIVQTGSFRSQQDAERQRATIAFQGLKGRINAVTSDSGNTWYRVETGPFESRSEMNAALDKLVAINIQPLVKKQKK
jgi:cell division protein FtsN